MTVVLTGRGNFDPGAQGVVVGPDLLKVAFWVQLLETRETLSADLQVGGHTRLDAVRRGFLEVIGKAGRRVEIFV